MTAKQSTGRSRPAKPRKDFPLFSHASGQWAKKINGRLCYFGVWADPEAALDRYLRQKDDLYAGRAARPVDVSDDGIDVGAACNHFLAVKEDLCNAGELAPRSWQDYLRTCARIVRVFGRHRLVADLRPDDFAGLRKDIARTCGPVALGNEINRVRIVFRLIYEAELIERQVRFGPTFKRPKAKTLRLERAKTGPRLFTAKQIHTLLDAASTQLRAMILLGVNAGLGNSDVGQLCLRHINLETGWLDYPRPKTGIQRRAKLWPETIEAVRDVAGAHRTTRRPELAELLFRTKYGGSWYKDTDNPVAKEFRKLANVTGVYRRGLTFYALRHTFATVASDAKDQVAINHVMGHVDESMPARYRERIADERLEAVSRCVRDWLFGK